MPRHIPALPDLCGLWRNACKNTCTEKIGDKLEPSSYTAQTQDKPRRESTLLIFLSWYVGKLCVGRMTGWAEETLGFCVLA